MKLPFVGTAAAAAAAASSCGRSVGGAAAATSYQSRITSLAASLRPRVLVGARGGSGSYSNSGEPGAAAAAFYTIDRLPPALANLASPSASSTCTNNNGGESSPANLRRVDLDLGPGRLAFSVDDVLSEEEADALAACAEAILEANGHSRSAPGIRTPPGMRSNEAAHWYPPRAVSRPLLDAIFDRFRHLVPPELDGMPLHGRLSEKIAQFKYNRGDFFNRHVDGLFPGQGANERGDGVEEWEGVVSGMSMLFYLNDGPRDGLEGGETRLWSADGRRHVDVTPRKGRVLFFRRGSGDAVMHAGLPVTGDVPKYMALINLAYGEQTGTRPLRV